MALLYARARNRRGMMHLVFQGPLTVRVLQKTTAYVMQYWGAGCDSVNSGLIDRAECKDCYRENLVQMAFVIKEQTYSKKIFF